GVEARVPAQQALVMREAEHRDLDLRQPAPQRAQRGGGHHRVAERVRQAHEQAAQGHRGYRKKSRRSSPGSISSVSRGSSTIFSSHQFTPLYKQVTSRHSWLASKRSIRSPSCPAVSCAIAASAYASVPPIRAFSTPRWAGQLNVPIGVSTWRSACM